MVSDLERSRARRIQQFGTVTTATPSGQRTITTATGTQTITGTQREQREQILSIQSKEKALRGEQLTPLEQQRLSAQDRKEVEKFRTEKFFSETESALGRELTASEKSEFSQMSIAPSIVATQLQKKDAQAISLAKQRERAKKRFIEPPTGVFKGGRLQEKDPIIGGIEAVEGALKPLRDAELFVTTELARFTQPVLSPVFLASRQAFEFATTGKKVPLDVTTQRILQPTSKEQEQIRESLAFGIELSSLLTPVPGKKLTTGLKVIKGGVQARRGLAILSAPSLEETQASIITGAELGLAVKGIPAVGRFVAGKVGGRGGQLILAGSKGLEQFGFPAFFTLVGAQAVGEIAPLLETDIEKFRQERVSLTSSFATIGAVAGLTGDVITRGTPTARTFFRTEIDPRFTRGRRALKTFEADTDFFIRQQKTRFKPLIESELVSSGRTLRNVLLAERIATQKRILSGKIGTQPPFTASPRARQLIIELKTPKLPSARARFSKSDIKFLRGLQESFRLDELTRELQPKEEVFTRLEQIQNETLRTLEKQSTAFERSQRRIRERRELDVEFPRVEIEPRPEPRTGFDLIRNEILRGIEKRNVEFEKAQRRIREERGTGLQLIEIKEVTEDLKLPPRPKIERDLLLEEAAKPKKKPTGLDTEVRQFQKQVTAEGTIVLQEQRIKQRLGSQQQRIKTAFKTETKVVPVTTAKQRQKQKEAQKVIFGTLSPQLQEKLFLPTFQRFKQPTVQKVKQPTLEKLITPTRERLVQPEVEITIPRQEEVIVTLEQAITLVEQTPVTFNPVFEEIITSQRTRQKIVPVLGLRDAPLINSFDPRKRSKQQGFVTEVRSKGKFRRLEGVRDKLSARSVGALLVDNSSPRTFRTRKTPEKINRRPRQEFNVLVGKFRQPKLKSKLPRGRTFVEKSLFAIDTPGEVREIPLAGVAAQLGFGFMRKKRKTKRKSKKRTR